MLCVVDEPAAASMWTRKDIKEFKESLRKDKDAMIKVGSGETVTVRQVMHFKGKVSPGMFKPVRILSEP